MPVTTTAKRALRGSKRKKIVNSRITTRLEIAMRLAKKTSTDKNLKQVYSLADRAAKKKVLHKNKVARIKRAFQLLQKTKKTSS